MNLNPSAGRNLKVLMRLAWPIGLSQLAQNSMSFVDTVMVGRLGSVQLAGISLGSTIYVLIIVVSIGTVLGVGPLVSQAFGADDKVAIRRYGRQGLWLAALLTPIGMGILWSAGWWIGYLNQPEEIIPIAVEYLKAVSFGMFPFLAFGALRSWHEALNRPLPITIIALTGVIVNILGNYAFIHGRFGFPAFGAIGTGYATSLTFWYLMVVIILYTISQKHFSEVRIFDQWRWPNWTYLKALIKVGAPMGATWGTEVGLFTATTILVGQMGTVTLAAHQIALQLAAMAFMVPFAISMASAIRVGNLTGAGEHVAARQAGWLSIGLGTGVMALSAAAFIAFPTFFVSIFIGQDGEAEVAVVAAKLLLFAGLFQLVDGAQATAAGALRGLKDTFIPMIIGIISYWCIGLTVGYQLSLKHGAPGLWMGLVVGLGFAAVLLIGRWWLKTKSVRKTV